MLDVLWSALRLAFASLVVGAGLNFLNVGPDRLLAAVGLTREDAVALAEQAANWALPNMAFGAAVLLPAWMVIHLLLPPRRRTED